MAWWIDEHAPEPRWTDDEKKQIVAAFTKRRSTATYPRDRRVVDTFVQRRRGQTKRGIRCTACLEFNETTGEIS